MSVFGECAEFYDAIYQDKDYMSEARTVDCLLKKYGDGIQSLLVFGCGTGKHDRCLEKLGYRIHGIDLSEEMIRVAKKASPQIKYEVGDIRSYETSEKYDAVISLFHVMSYQATNEDIKNALKSAHNSLNNGGLLLFDVWYGPGVLTDRPSKRIKEVLLGNRHLKRIATPRMHPNENIVDVKYDFIINNEINEKIADFTEEHHMRYFFKPEMEEYLHSSGFKLIDCIDCKACNKPTFGSWTCFFIARYE